MKTKAIKGIVILIFISFGIYAGNFLYNRNNSELPSKYLSMLEDLDKLLYEKKLKDTDDLQIKIINLEEQILEEYPEYVTTVDDISKEGHSEYN